MRKVLFIASTGGHLSEILKLDKVMKKYESYLVTEKTDTTKELSVKNIKRIDYLLNCNKSHLTYVYKAPYNLIKSLIIFLKIKPDVIITTGAHTGVGMCYIGKIFRKKVIYIETLANIETRTLSGRLVYPIADLFIVQWKSMLKLYPKAVLGGWLF